MVGPIKKMMIHSQAAEVLAQYIREKAFKNGDRLPSERELATMLSIGRNSVREALRTLEAMNLVEVLNGRGVYVKDADATSGINMRITFAKVNFLELLDVRRTLEKRAIELVIQNAGEKDLHGIEQALLRLEEKAAVGGLLVKEDTDFHHAIYRACHNKTLFEIIRPLSDTFRTLWEPFRQVEEVLQQTLCLHRPLFEAIKDRNTEQALAYFNQIIDLDEKTIRNFVS